jgi:hypothetical protein
VKLELNLDEIKVLRSGLGKEQVVEWPHITDLRKKMDCIIQAAEIEVGKKYIS